MNINELRESKFLKKEDVGKGVLLTIQAVRQENVAKEGAPPEMKWTIEFAEMEKPMVLNSTNGQLIAQITGSEESEGWIGKKVVLFTDPSVSFAGNVVGGIRVRAPKVRATQPAPAPAPAPAQAPAQDSATPPRAVKQAINQNQPSPAAYDDTDLDVPF